MTSPRLTTCGWPWSVWTTYTLVSHEKEDTLGHPQTQEFGGAAMASHVKPVPDNSSVVMPRLFCRDPAAEIEFCQHTFGAVELNRRPGPNGGVAHALVTIGPAMVMIEAEWPQA